MQSDSFMSEGNLGRNGNLNTTTMKEMWDYESREPFSGKTGDISEKAPERSGGSQAKSNNECELCVETTKLNSVLMKENLV